MSLVQAAICGRFVLVCGEQQLNLTTGGVLHNFRKVFKVNDSVIIGLSGAIEDNYYLFQDYINVDFTLKEGCTDSLEEVFDRVAARYQEMTDQGECDVFSLVCGWNGVGFEAKTYYINSVCPGSSQIAEVKPAHEMDGRLISCGDNRHYENFFNGVNRYGFDVNGVQRAFRDVLSQGVLFDDYIDTNAQFEVIRRPE